MRVEGYSGYDWRVGSKRRTDRQEGSVTGSGSTSSGSTTHRVASDSSQRQALGKLWAMASEIGLRQFKALSSYLTTSSYKQLDEANSVELVGIDTYA
ncbi:hypothetical protein [Pokkaliibacter plantistimulans]|uniref:hypothetical protein n=1 Tax=Pokkaliibacter plantistimulans TaxID=1635171 RepID=UPI001057E7D5|nr:hypothetical protein [Pokkaliibacter plantistimulans]